MKRQITFKSALCVFITFMYNVGWAQVPMSENDVIANDGTLRFYRLAIPVTRSAYEQDLGSSYDNVKVFWQECEDFANKMFVPLGFCFDVIEDESLVIKQTNLIEENIYNAPSFGTELLDEIISSSSYDVGMWVVHRDVEEENSGLSILGGAYDGKTKGSGYAKTDKWVVAHELGHMFGAHHTAQGEGSLMDNQGEYFAYPSIKTIRSSAQGTLPLNNVKVENNTPQFDEAKMQKSYRIPQGACLAIEAHATDAENHKLMYTAIGCNSGNVDEINGDDGMMPFFASFAPQEGNVINYSPVYTADLFYDDYFYLKEGTGIHAMCSGTYDLSILVNDVPDTAWGHEVLAAAPFYSTYAIWETQVEIIEGTPFRATLSPAKDAYAAGESITIHWGVNTSYFTTNSRLRITLSDDYGKTFKYVLAEGVSALAGECIVMAPNVPVGEIEVNFITAMRKMRGGIIKLEEIGGAAYTLTMLDPTEDKSFTIKSDATGIDNSAISNQQTEMIFDLQGRRIVNPTKGLYIVNGVKMSVK